MVAYKRLRAPRLRIEITEEIIAQSERRSSSHCMIAEAVRNHFPWAKKVSVDLGTIRFTDPVSRTRFIYPTPDPGRRYLIAFDQGQHVEPWVLQLRNAMQIVRGAISGRKTTGGEDDGVTPPQRRRGTVRAASVDAPSLGATRLQSEGGGSIPTKIGGTAPPYGPLLHPPSVRRRKVTPGEPAGYTVPGNLAKRRWFGAHLLNA